MEKNDCGKIHCRFFKCHRKNQVNTPLLWNVAAVWRRHGTVFLDQGKTACLSIIQNQRWDDTGGGFKKGSRVSSLALSCSFLMTLEEKMWSPYWWFIADAYIKGPQCSHLKNTSSDAISASVKIEQDWAFFKDALATSAIIGFGTLPWLCLVHSQLLLLLWNIHIHALRGLLAALTHTVLECLALVVGRRHEIALQHMAVWRAGFSAACTRSISHHLMDTFNQKSSWLGF